MLEKKPKSKFTPPVKKMSEKTISSLESALEYQKIGDYDSASTIFKKILNADPNNSFANHFLGLILFNKGDSNKAIDLMKTAAHFDPFNARIFNDLGIALDELRRYKEAILHYRKALKLRPKFPEALNNLGCALAKIGEEKEPETCFRKALQIDPNNLDALNNIGNLLMINERYNEAEESFRKVLRQAPKNPDFLINLGSALQFLERIEEAKNYFKRALEIKPNHVEALCKLANALKCGGFAEQAIQYYDQATKIEPENIGIKISSATVLPIIPASANEIDFYRARMQKNLIELKNCTSKLIDPLGEAGATGFYLAYHNKNDREHVKVLAELYAKKCPSLITNAPEFSSTKTKNRYRIGFLSFHFYDHTIGKLYKGFIEHINREFFEIILFRTSKKSDNLALELNAFADKVVYLLTNFEQAREDIRNEELDLLFYPDIGMDAFTYFLAFSRLAPVQITSWGHPNTSGIQNIDYYISSRDLEIENGDAHYSEKLVRLKDPPTYYYRPEKPIGKVKPTDYNLPRDAHIYLCPQTLFKFHPDFDNILGKILENDPKGQLLLISGRYKSKEDLIIERFTKTFPKSIDRITFLPRMSRNDFLRVIQMSHVVLDPIYFSGGNSSAETIAMGIPIVTLPGNFLRDRVTYSFFKIMGINDLIVNNAEEYISLAYKIANDSFFREKVSMSICQKAGLLFENIEIVNELQEFFIAAIQAYRKGDALVDWNPD